VIDLSLTTQIRPMIDGFWMSVFKELVTIGPDVCVENPSYDLVARLAIAASFALNLIFGVGKEICGGIHAIGHQLTAEYGIDHGATLAICSVPFLTKMLEKRKTLLSAYGNFVWGIEGTDDEKAQGFLTELRKFIQSIQQPLKVSDWKGAVIKENDVEKVTKMVLQSRGGKSFGINGDVTEEIVRSVLQEVII
jgi:alcohol dehydrogenase YqhD (iron-dependent ADH family)